MNKSSIRKRLLKLRIENYSKNLSISSTKLYNFLSIKRFKKKIIGGYYPFNYELDILNVLKVFEKKDYILSLPKIAKNNEMDFFQWSFREPLKINKYGIPETISNKKIYPNILLIPLVGFDNQLNRLGYGGGYYDRYLESVHKNSNRPLLIGLIYDFQLIDDSIDEIHDIKLDVVFSETQIKNFVS